MDRPDSVPPAVSFRQLEHWRQRAADPAGSAAAPPACGPAAGAAAPLELLLSQYEHLSQQLLRELGRQAENLHQQRSGDQLMALGALTAHLRLGLQALAASRR